MIPLLTFTEFNRLSPAEQEEHLEEYGTFLDVARWTDRHQVNLFELYGFYVEVYYHHPTDTLVRFEAHNDYGRLDPFLSMVDLTPVYSLL